MKQNFSAPYIAIFVFFLLGTLCFSKYALSECLPGNLGDTGDTDAVTSRDPNALTGPAGFGEKHYFPADKFISYRIDFENDYTAAVPAQQVDITNQLEEGLDWDSFTLTEIGFGDQFIAVPPDSKQFQTTVPMTYSDITFEVWINAGIDVSTGKVYAHFYSIDPETGWSPPVEIGFLPPEDGTGRGMGHIGYTINHVKDLEEKSEIRNVALIVFDLGEHIYTNQIDPHDLSQGTNPELEAPITIDRGTPVSSMVSMPEESSDSKFFVSWGGSDSASGIANYNIYVRDSQEVNWQLWLERTTETSAEFIGTPGYTHEFYSLAIDNVGHFEQKHPVPDATIFVNPAAVVDSDNDGIIDTADNCPSVANGEQSDLDQDGMGDKCDADDDADGVVDINDNCPLISNATQEDQDKDSLGDLCDLCPLDVENDSDGDGVCGDVDNCQEFSNSDQADLDEDSLGDICDPQTCGNGTLETIELCDDSNFIDGDGCSSLCISESTISVRKAEVEWDDGLIKYKGNITLPFGVFPENVTPQSDVFVEVANLEPIVIEQIVFSVKGDTGEKWEIKEDRNLKKFKINWKGATFDYNGIIRVKSSHIGQDITSLEIEREGLSGEFLIQLGGVSIQVRADNTVVTSPAAIEVDADDDDGEIEVDLPFALTPDMIMVISRPDQPDAEIVIGDYFTNSIGKFDLQVDFDTAGYKGLDLPAILKLRFSLGQVGYPGYSEINSGWKTIKEKEWKYK